MEVRIAVAREGQRREAFFPDHNAEFLVQFPDQRVLGPLAGLDLAARKLPKARHRLAFGPLRQQHAPVGVDQGASGNKNDFDAHGLSPNVGNRGLSGFNAIE